MFKVQRQGGGRDRWCFDELEVQGEILLTLHSPADAIIGHYRLTVLLMSPDGHIVEKLDKISFHLLFNPWCKGKGCFLKINSFKANQNVLSFHFLFLLIYLCLFHFNLFYDLVFKKESLYV